MSRPLVIVESPAKAKTIARHLGSGYDVRASVGHIADLPTKGLGIDIDRGFEPQWELTARGRDVVKELRGLLREASEVYLATDEDREGEAISWHLLQHLKPKVPVKRMVFHEITKAAIDSAVANPRDIDDGLVEAAETRRILDRLYGWKVSPVLIRKVNPGLSAGRVQSPATRLIVQRERERMAFVAASYWDIEALLATDPSFTATLVGVDGTRVATGKDFGSDGRPGRNVLVLDEARATALADGLAGRDLTVRSVEEKPYRSNPKPPFMTSTLQQEGGRKLRLSAAQVMRVAQGLYERGYITYMRTDSVTLSTEAVAAVRATVASTYGDRFLSSAPRQFANKVKNAQEAHEAIRPSTPLRSPDQLARELHGQELGLYRLIWQRTLASQMAEATGTTLSVRLGAVAGNDARRTEGPTSPNSNDARRTEGPTSPNSNGARRTEGPTSPNSNDARRTEGPTSPNSNDARRTEGPTSPNSIDGMDCEFAASGTTITFPGYRQAYVESSDESADADLADQEAILPALTVGQGVPVESLTPNGHSTTPPARYTEASLVKRLEELGIGRPSTWATVIQTILDRGYAWKKGQALVPTWTAFAVVRLLEEHFDELVDYAFTARFEDVLDAIALGDHDKLRWLRDFYFGVENPPGLERLVEENLDKIDAAQINTFVIGHDDAGEEVVVKPGKYGPYVKRGDVTAGVPEDLAPDELTLPMALELLAAPRSDEPIGVLDGLPVYAKNGRYGPYVQWGDADSPPPGYDKPKMSSLFKTMTLERITIAQAEELLSLPRTIGVDPADGVEVVAANGRYGPYVSKGKESRSLTNEEQLLTVTIDEALSLLAQPRQFRRGGGAPKPPMRAFGNDPVSERPVVAREGRFGIYVTDGETNASIGRGDRLEEMSAERAYELLAVRRDQVENKGQGQAKKPRARKAGGTKKAAARKSAPRRST
jgi:DNA topoisomerase I